MLTTFRKFDLALIAAAAMASVLLLLSLPAPWPQVASFLLLLFLPTLSWSKRRPGALSERILLGGAIALFLNLLAILLLAYMPGPVSRGLQLAVHFILFFIPLIPSGKAPTSIPRPHVRWELLLAIVAVLLLRLPNLGYSEFQGDEAVVMVRAAAIITGDDAELFLHQKGPAEILLPLGLWNLAGTTNETWARIPFVWANGLAILAVICLARRWFGLGEALLAGLFFALIGFTVAFGRIVQYQSLVMLWGTAAVLAAVRYDEEGKASDLSLGAILLATALLAHYDAVLVAPAFGWIFIRRIKRTGRWEWRPWAISFGAALIILVAFYVPYATSPNAVSTGRYLLQARLGAADGAGLLSWSGSEVWQMLTFYNSTYYIVGLGGLSLIALWQLRRKRLRFEAVLLFVAPLLFYLAIVEDPRTHVYTLAGGGSILAAVGAVYVARRIIQTKNRLLVAGGGAVFLMFLLVSANYIYLIFIDHTPERQRSWAENRPAGYLTTWKDPPLYGLFGFPHQSGWRGIAELISASSFPYASNEEEEITNWYLSQAPRTHCADFRTFIYSGSVQDAIPYEEGWIDQANLQYRVLVGGRPGLFIYGFGDGIPAQTVDASDKLFWAAPSAVVPRFETGAYAIDVTLGEGVVRLLGYDLDVADARPGGQVVVTLYWQALAPFERNYQTFVHLTGDQLLTQDDTAPECGINPTTRWEPGQVIPDPHILPVPSDVGDQQLTLYAGMYDLLTSQPLFPPSGNDHRIPLRRFTIEAPG